MAPICELCRNAESKYKCPSCGLRYCSLTCYKPHKLEHDEQKEITTAQAELQVPQTKQKIDRPGTTQRVAKQSFKDFENDEEFQRLLKRYPALQTQLQGIYALTMDPGPDEHGWNRSQLPLLRPNFQSMRGARGRARAGQRGRGPQRGGRGDAAEGPEGRQSGRWTKEKGDLEALYVMRRGQEDDQHEDLVDGLQEFVELVQMRFARQPGTAAG